MKKLKIILLLSFFLAITFFSCKKDTAVVTSVNFGYNYYPNNVGHYVIYQVDSVYANTPNQFDSTRYLLKELVAATFLDNANRPTLRIERYYEFYHFNTHSWDTAWSAPKVWSANRTQTTLERKEENITYVKLIFPTALNKQWNGNVYNSFGDKEYKLTSVDQPETINNSHFDSVATVNQYLNANIINYQFQEEKFARNVGIIYKEQDSLYLNKSPVTSLYTDTTGYKFTQKIISYGK